jgi:hypothetical protein
VNVLSEHFATTVPPTDTVMSDELRTIFSGASERYSAMPGDLFFSSTSPVLPSLRIATGARMRVVAVSA